MLEGVVSWNVNTACNYRCSYCTQKLQEDRGRWSRDTPRFLKSFSRLPGRWEIKLSGGEPFVHPTLDEITEGLAAIGHRISIVTNFSATEQKLHSFLRAAKGRVGVFSCSLHLEYVSDVDAYIEKAAAFSRSLLECRDASLPFPSLNVTTVATHAALPHIRSLQRRFSEKGVTFKVQPEKIEGGIVEYTQEEQALLEEMGGHNRTGQIAHCFTGEPCWAGTRYFVLDDKGIAYRCYPARRQKIERLGDFLSDSFSLFSGPRPCPYPLCYCTVPIERGFVKKQTTNALVSGQGLKHS